MEAEKYKNMKQYECRQGCGRKFVETALKKHEKLCLKVFQKKNKVFSSFNQRNQIEGVNLKKVNENQLKKEKEKRGKARAWEVESLKLRQLMREAKGLPPPPMNKHEKELLNKYEDQSKVKCPVCGRSFESKAGERHIKFCQEKAKQNQYKTQPTKKEAPKRRF